MITALRALVVLLGSVFIMMGIRWHVSPQTAAESLGMSLLDGLGRSTQIADLAAFFLMAGVCVLSGTVTRNRTWFYPPIILMGAAAIGRILSWLLHDAALAVDLIAAEIFFAVVFLLASRRLAERSE